MNQLFRWQWLTNHQKRHMRSISGSTKVFGIIGNPVSHSMSPALHNRAFEVAGIDAVYVPFRVDQTGDFLKQSLLHFGISGLSVTIPHKIWAASSADRCDPLSKLTGASNTLLIRTDDLPLLDAFNTDGPGALRALQRSVSDFRNKRILIIGYGGSARAIAAELLLSTDADLIMISGRNKAKADDFVKFFSQQPDHNFQNRLQSADTATLQDKPFDVVINTTPLGMKGFAADLPFDVRLIEKHHVVMDIVYNPEMTPLLATAKNAKSEVVTGRWMLLYQAVRQFELFTETTASEEIESAMAEALSVQLSKIV